MEIVDNPTPQEIPKPPEDPRVILSRMQKNEEQGEKMDVPAFLKDIQTLDQTEATKKPPVLELLRDLGKDPLIWQEALRQAVIANTENNIANSKNSNEALDITLRTIELLGVNLDDPVVRAFYLPLMNSSTQPASETPEGKIVAEPESSKQLTQEEIDKLPANVSKEGADLLEKIPLPPGVKPSDVKPLAQWEIDSLLSAVPEEERNLLFEPTPEEIKRYNQPWQEIFGPEAELLNKNSTKDVYRPKEHPEIVVKVAKAINNVSFLLELKLEKEALLKLQDSKHVPRLLGIGPNYLVEEFIQGKEMRETFYVSDSDEAKCFPVKAGEEVNNTQRGAASWLVSAMEALTEIHERGLAVTNFRWSHWLWNEEGQRTVIVNLKEARTVGERGNLSEENYAFIKQLQYNKDINTIMRLFLSNIKGFSQEMVFHDKTTSDHLAAFWLGGKTILDKDGGEKLKQTASALGASESLKRVIEMFTGAIDAPRKAPSTQEYTQALKDYFDEVGILKKT